MKLTANELKTNLEKQNAEIQRIEGVETTLISERDGIVEALSGVVDVGEYDAIAQELHQNISSEIQKTKQSEVTDKLEAVNTQLEQNNASNQNTIEGLNNNLDRVGSIRNAEVAAGVNDIIAEAKRSFSEALGERTDIATRLESAKQAVESLGSESNKIDM